MQTYTDQQVAEALAALELHGGNVKRTAAATGIPRPTLIRWRDAVSVALNTIADTAEAPPSVPDAVAAMRAKPEPRDFAALWGEAQEAAVARILELLPTTDSLRDVAYAAGIAGDKHMDYRDGRKGAGVNLNAEKMIVVIE